MISVRAPPIKVRTHHPHAARILALNRTAPAVPLPRAVNSGLVIESAAKPPRELYRERQWVPWHWWIFGGFIVMLLAAQIGHNRSAAWLYGTAILFGALAIWSLLSLSATTVSVTEDAEGTRWLRAGNAQLPADVVSNALMVPATAKRNAMGKQLDPAAFVVSHGWVPQMAMLVLDDPEDPTPYWLIGSKNPEALLAAFLPEKFPAESAG